MRRIFIALVFLFPAFSILAQDYVLDRSVISASGARLENEDMVIQFTIGQALFQPQIHENMTVLWGYWHWPDCYTGVEEEDLLPKYIFELKQNYPNPFNPVTTIPYSIGKGLPVLVNLRIYDVRGALVRTLVDEVKEPGQYKAVWDGLNESGRRVSSGIYFYRIEANTFIKTKKLVLLR